MSQALLVIDELESALKSNSTERHHAILKSVTDLFLAGCDRMTEEISSVFDDVIAVAGPVRAQSPRLTDQNLVEIAASKGQSHLSKIAERAQLSPGVTDVLVDRGDREVVTKVAVNRLSLIHISE